MKEITISSKKSKEVIDITEDINEQIATSGLSGGICFIFLKHTTAALTTADLDPGTDLDMLDVLEEMVPKLNFRHPHNPKHAPDHIVSSIIGSSITIPFESKNLILGTWQRVILVELDGPRERNIVISYK